MSMDKLKLLKTMSGESDEDILNLYLEMAGERIIRKAYPYKKYDECLIVPAEYNFLHVEIACYLLNKRGAEGENYHSENGINRTYESASVPDSMLSVVIPRVGVL